MRRFLLAAVAAVFVLTGCSSSVPRFPAVYSPPPTPTDAPVEPAATAADSASSAAPAPSVDTSAWYTLSADHGIFQVLMPAQPTPSSQTVKVGAGNATVTIWTYTDNSKRTFSANHVAFAAGALAGATAKQIFDQAQASIVASLQGATVTGTSDIKWGKYSGREIRYGNATVAVVARFYIAGDDVVGVDVGTPVGMADDGFAAAFFASFQIAA
jgi:hypothetical protein